MTTVGSSGIGMYGKNINGKGCNRWNYALRLLRSILLHLFHVDGMYGTFSELWFLWSFLILWKGRFKILSDVFSVNAWFLQPCKWNCRWLHLTVTPSVDTCMPCTLWLNALQPSTVSNKLNARQLNIFTQFPPKGSFKLLKNIKCLLRNANRI